MSIACRCTPITRHPFCLTTLSPPSLPPKQGRATEAVEDFGQAVEIAPEAPVPYLNRAIALEQLGVDLMDEGEKDAAQER